MRMVDHGHTSYQTCTSSSNDPDSWKHSNANANSIGDIWGEFPDDTTLHNSYKITWCKTMSHDVKWCHIYTLNVSFTSSFIRWCFLPCILCGQSVIQAQCIIYGIMLEGKALVNRLIWTNWRVKYWPMSWMYDPNNKYQWVRCGSGFVC